MKKIKTVILILLIFILSACDSKYTSSMNDVVENYNKSNSENFLSVDYYKIAYSDIGIDKANTATHWLLSSDLGFNVLKGDVEITSDGELIMCHDPGFTFNKNGKITSYDKENCTKIIDLTYEQCRSKEYDVDYDLYGECLSVADIDDFLRICKDKNKICFITIRTTKINQVIEKIIEKIKLYGMEKRTIVNSTNLNTVQVFREYQEADEIAVSYVYSKNKPITNEIVDVCKKLENCFLTVWCGNDKNIVENSKNAIDYALSMNVPILAAIISEEQMWETVIENGMIGAQVRTPFFNIANKRYFFQITVSDGIATLKQLFCSDKFNADITLTDNVLCIKNIKTKNTYLPNVIDGILPIKMNLFSYNLSCLDRNGTNIPIFWKDNSLKIMLLNNNPNTYTIIIDV